MNNSLSTDKWPVTSSPVSSSTTTPSTTTLLRASTSTSSAATSLCGDTLAQAKSKAQSDCLPGIIAAIQVQSQSVASNTSHTVSCSFSSSTSASLPQTPGHQQQHPAASTGNISVPCFVSTFCTYSNPIFGLPSLASSACSQSTIIGGPVASSFPAISNSAPLIGRDFVIGPRYSPIPNKLVSKIISSQFVELADLLQDNLKINETETQTFLDGKLVVSPAPRQTIEIQDILTWVEAFTTYSLACSLCLPAIEMARSVTVQVINNPDVVGLLAVVGFAMPARFASGSTEGKPALTSLHRGNIGLGHPPPAEKNARAVTPSSPHHLILNIVLVALVPKLWFLVPVCYIPVQVPVVGTHRPVGPVCVFPHSHIPMVVGHCSVISLQTIWVLFLQSTILTC